MKVLKIIFRILVCGLSLAFIVKSSFIIESNIAYIKKLSHLTNVDPWIVERVDSNIVIAWGIILSIYLLVKNSIILYNFCKNRFNLSKSERINLKKEKIILKREKLQKKIDELNIKSD